MCSAPSSPLAVFPSTRIPPDLFWSCAAQAVPTVCVANSFLPSSPCEWPATLRTPQLPWLRSTRPSTCLTALSSEFRHFRWRTKNLERPLLEGLGLGAAFLRASLDLLVRLLSLDIPEAFSSDPATQEASRGEERQRVCGEARSFVLGCLGSDRSDLFLRSTSDFHMAQSRVLLYVCYLLKNACNEPSGSSEQLPTQGGTHESVMGRFAAKALKELPHSIVRLLRALRPPLLLKRKTVSRSEECICTGAGIRKWPL